MSFSQDDILTLAKAGFTANQIIALGSIQTPAPAPAPAPAPVAPAPAPAPVAPAPAPAPVAPAPAPAPVAPAPVAPAPDPFQLLFEQIGGIKQAIQSSNIQNSTITTQPQTTDDILASIIQPTKKEDIK